MEALARKMGPGITKSDVMRAFIAAGCRANPLTEREIRELLTLEGAAPKAPQRDPVIEVLEDGSLKPLRGGDEADTQKDGGETGIRTRSAKRSTQSDRSTRAGHARGRKRHRAIAGAGRSIAQRSLQMSRGTFPARAA